jgi:hypothetical protein
MRRTRSRAGTKSSISLIVSPMTWSAPPQQGQTAPAAVHRDLSIALADKHHLPAVYPFNRKGKTRHALIGVAVL